MRLTSARSIAGWAGACLGFAAGACGAYAGLTWLRYGDAPRPSADEDDPLLDRFMPAYEVVERHHVHVRAPAETTLEAAKTVELSSHPIVSAIFRAREVILGATPGQRARPAGLLDDMLSLGWVVLADSPGREVVVGAVTRPWEAEVTFRSVAPELFAAFNEPDYVKIAWTLRADPLGPDESVFRTETRVIATDASGRARFRRYWAFLSPGITVIRQMSLGPVKAEAERRANRVSSADGVSAGEERRPA